MVGDSRTGHIASCSNSTRGIMAGGEAPSRVNTITYITINTLGNGIDFGDLIAVRNDQDAVASQTRGFVVAGSTGSITNLIDFVTITSTGNAQDFGDLTDARDPGVFSSLTRGVACSGDYPSNVNIIDFIEIMTTANAVDFGDMLTKTSSPQTCSNAHGGLADDM